MCTAFIIRRKSSCRKRNPWIWAPVELQGVMLRSNEELSRRRKSKTKTAEAICAMERANKNESSST